MSAEAAWGDFLWRLAMNSSGTVESDLCDSLPHVDESGLGDKTRALIRLAVLIAVGSAPTSYQWAVNDARAAGALDNEIVGVLLTVAHILDSAWVRSAAAALARPSDSSSVANLGEPLEHASRLDGGSQDGPGPRLACRASLDGPCPVSQRLRLAAFGTVGRHDGSAGHG